MQFTIIEKEEKRLDAVLPKGRLEERPPAELLDAAQVWSRAVWMVAEQLGPVPLSPAEIVKGLALAKKPVFFVGVHRSGTTLVRNLLDGHPSLVVLPSEGTYYTNLETKLLTLPANERAAFLAMEWLRRLANPINQPPYWLLGRSTNETSPYVDFARYVLAWWQVLQCPAQTQWPHVCIVLAYACCTNNLSAKYWVDKTPTNDQHLQRIKAEAPNAKIIHVIRNPVDTLTSRKKMEPWLNLRRVLADMKRSFAIAQQQHDDQYILLRYEALCSDAEKVMNEVAVFLDIEPSPILMQPTVANMPAGANSSFGNNNDAGTIQQPAQRVQQLLLSKKEQLLLSAYIGDVASNHGYVLPKVNLLQSLYARLKHRLV